MPLTAILVAALAVPTLSAVLGWALAAALLVVIVGRFVFSLFQKYNEGEPEGHHIQSLYAVSLGLSFFLLSSVAGIWLSGFNVLLPVPVLVGAFLFYLRMENGDKMPDAGKGNKRPKDFIIHYPLKKPTSRFLSFFYY